MSNRKIRQGLLGALVLAVGLLQFQPALVELGVSYLTVSLVPTTLFPGVEGVDE